MSQLACGVTKAVYGKGELHVSDPQLKGALCSDAVSVLTLLAAGDMLGTLHLTNLVEEDNGTKPEAALV